MVLLDTDAAVLTRLPTEWQDLFKLLHRSQEQATVWFTEVAFSQYGTRPLWHILFSSLKKQDPYVFEEKLVFKPRFLLLSKELQEKLLLFLMAQSYIIPDSEIRDFVLATVRSVQSEGKYSPVQLKDAIKGISPPEADVLSGEPMDGSQKSVIILDESDQEEDIQEPAAKRPRLENHAEDQASKEHGVTNQYKQMDSGSENVTVAQLVNSDKGPNDLESDSDHLKGRDVIVCKLKEIWHNCLTDKEVDALREISKLSLKEIEVFCQLMDFSSMSDDSIELVCQHLCNVADSLGYSSAVSILTYVLGHQILNLSKNASRKLSGAVTLLAEKFPKQVVDSLLAPCFKNREINVAQCDLICQTMKENIGTSVQGYFIQKVIENGLSLSENNLTVLQTVIDSNCDLTKETFSQLLECLSENTSSLSKNLKYGKLLLALVKQQGKLFNQQLKSQFLSILERYDTFLKKSISAALNKIKV